MTATAVKPASDKKTRARRLNETQREILSFLSENKDCSVVGEIGSSRGNTIRALETLEEYGLIECVMRPAKIAPRGLGTSWQPVEGKCGVWR